MYAPIGIQGVEVQLENLSSELCRKIKNTNDKDEKRRYENELKIIKENEERISKEP